MKLENTPGAAGFSMPAEWSPHVRTWMAWPCRDALWYGRIDQARTAFARVVRVIAGLEPVSLVIDSKLDDAAWRPYLGDALAPHDIDIIRLPLDDSWMRDIGPTFVRDQLGRVAGIDWQFNAWGGKWPDFAADAAIAEKIVARVKGRRFAAPFVLEGGAIHVDGAGTILTSEQCLLNPNRNPSLGRQEIEAALKEWLGGRHVIWLGQGLDNDDTDGHVDNLACFVKPGVVLASSCEDPADPNHKVLHDNLHRLRTARDASGKPLEIIELPIPDARFGHAGRLACNYVNFYLANGAVIAPSFDDRNDARAAEILRKVFRRRAVVQVPALAILEGGGGIHCITQQQPAGPPAEPLAGEEN